MSSRVASVPASSADWVMRLRPSEASSAGDQSVVYEDDAQVRDRFGDNAWLWAREMGERVSARVAETHPGYREGGLPSTTFRHAVHAGVLRVLLSVGAGEHVPLMTVETQLANQDFVRRGIPLSTIIDGIHRCIRWLLDDFLEQIDRYVEEPDRSKQMRRVVPLVLTAFDDFIRDFQNSYLREHARWAMGLGAARRELVQQILDQQDVDLTKASETLDYPLDGEHTAVVVSAPEGGSGHALHTFATAFMRQLGADRQLLTPAGPNLVWGWCTPVAADGALPAGEHVAEVMRVAIGRSYPGVPGFRISHLQAIEALRIADQTRRSGITRYRDVEVAALLSANGELAARFASDELGALAENTPENVELRNTVWAYLQANGSLVHAGERLYINRNTVAYRIAKADRLLGQSVKMRRLELLAALRILRNDS